jgi:hypothetical protein
MANNAADKRFWTWTFAELEVYFGIRRGGTSHYLKRKDFHPEILGVVNPKQLVDTATHAGFVPIRMGEDGKRVINRQVEKMLGGIPHGVMDKAVHALEQSDRQNLTDYHKSFMAVQRRSPLDTMATVAERRNIDVRTLYRHLRHALDYISWYLDAESEGWKEGTAV